MKFVYFGSSEFSRVALKALVKAGKVPSLVVTVSDKPAGRGLKVMPMPVKQYALAMGIEIMAPSNLKDDSFLERLKLEKADIFIAVSYGRIIPENILKIARIMPIAVHPSLLPLYRGAAPINWAIINGEERTGISVIKVSKKVDAGDIIVQRPVDIDETDNAITLFDKLADLSGRILVDTINAIEKGEYIFTPQDESKATFAPKIRKDDGRILWDKSAFSIRNRVRGLLPWPGAFTFYKGKILKVLEAKAYDEPAKVRPSVIVKVDKDGIYVSTGEGILAVKKVKPEGKREMEAYAFSCGHSIKAGEALGK